MEQFFQQLINGLMIGSTYAVVALGFGLIFSVMRVENLAHPELFMVGAYVAFVVITRLHVPGQGLGVSVAVGVFVDLARWLPHVSWRRIRLCSAEVGWPACR